jgi:pyridoxine 5-phosphate synthase
MPLTNLSVNLNKVALLRNARTVDRPDLGFLADIAVEAGCQGITVHPRPDLRHIRPDDVRMLKQRTSVELNIEGNPFSGATAVYPGFLALVSEVRPAQCTLVPDSDSQSTSDHGFNLEQDSDYLKPVIQTLKQLGCRVSLFLDPDPEQVRRAPGTGADRIELYTGPYAESYAKGTPDAWLKRYAEAGRIARDLGLGLNAGHDLNRDNLGPFLDTVGPVDEVSIGHALMADALELGLSATVQAYLAIIRAANT